MDTTKYHEHTNNKLKALQDTSTNSTLTEVIAQRLNTILTTTSLECQANKTKARKPSNFKWHKDLKPLVKESNRVVWQWKEAGKPKDPETFHLIAMRLAKAHLRQSQKRLTANERVQV